MQTISRQLTACIVRSRLSIMINIGQLGWLAGVIDGEGTITISKQNRGNYYSYKPEIHITNINFLILRKAQFLFKKISGDHVKIFVTDNKRENKVYRVRVQSINGCKNILKALTPHLIGKKKQAEIVLKWLSRERVRKNSAIQADKIHNLNLIIHVKRLRDYTPNTT